MNLSLDCQIATDNRNIPTITDIEQWVSLAIGHRMDNAQICVRIVDEEEITELNYNYRAKEKPTNKLHQYSAYSLPHSHSQSYRHLHRLVTLRYHPTG